MNSSIIIDDIRRRSIRVQRDQILEQIKREEEIEALTIPKRFILEAEERAKERVSDQSWKKNFFLAILYLISGFLIIKFTRSLTATPSPPPPVSTSVPEPIPEPEGKKNVRFNLKSPEPIPESEYEPEEYEPNKLELLMRDYPKTWRDFSSKFTADWLMSDVSGKMQFDFFDEDGMVAVDYDPGDFFKFPNSLTNDEIQFQNMIYDRDLKRTICEEKNIEYREITID
jgi:hypothetical protein